MTVKLLPRGSVQVPPHMRRAHDPLAPLHALHLLAHLRKGLTTLHAELTLEAQTADRPETTGRMLSVVAGEGFEPPTSGL